MNPWDDEFFKGNKSKWISFCRSALRKQWMRYPVKIQFLNSRKFKKTAFTKNGIKKEIYHATCDICKKDYKMAQVEVDHIIPAGSMNELENMGFWASRLFCHRDNLQILCKKCHSIKSVADYYNVSFEKGKKYKKLVEFKKLKSVIQQSKLKKLDINRTILSKTEEELLIIQ